jgi:hypothetical protein
MRRSHPEVVSVYMIARRRTGPEFGGANRSDQSPVVAKYLLASDVAPEKAVAVT